MPLQATSGAASYDAFGGGVPFVPTYIEDVMSVWLYTGNGSTQTINNGIDLSGEGGLVWIKSRNAGQANNFYDTARGVSKVVFSNSTSGEFNFAGYGVTNFGSTGFSVTDNSIADYYVNGSGTTYASWTFRKQSKFFDIVTYTGNGTDGRSIPHNLGSTPGSIIVKCTNTSATNWFVWHRSIANNGLLLDSTSAAQSYYWSPTDTPTSTNILVSGSYGTNVNGETYVAYLFAHDAGGFGLTGTDNVISCGSFTTDSGGSATINLGYEPQWVLTKLTTGAQSWFITDTMRGYTANYSNNAVLFPNLSDAETANLPRNGSLTSTGFQYNGAGVSNGTYIYIAIRRGPMKVPTTGASVFSPIAVTNSAGTNNTTNFTVDLQINSLRSAASKLAVDRLRGVSTTATNIASYLATNNVTAESGSGSGSITRNWSNTGFQTSDEYGSLSTIYWNFGRAPGFFDEVCYTGNSSSANVPQSVTHNLGVTPELIIIKGRTTTDATWLVGYNFTPTQFDNGYLYLPNASNPIGYNIAFFGAAPTSSTFSVTNQNTFNPSENNSNRSGNNYVAYLFASCPGVSKVGSFTGTGATQVINCGFTGGARFVLIKATSTTGGWYVWDSARGIVAGNDPYLLLNSTAAEVTTTDWVDTAATGFELSNAGGNLANSNGVSYIFLAIA